jgi:hypothetical protein
MRIQPQLPGRSPSPTFAPPGLVAALVLYFFVLILSA